MNWLNKKLKIENYLNKDYYNNNKRLKSTLHMSDKISNLKQKKKMSNKMTNLSKIKAKEMKKVKMIKIWMKKPEGKNNKINILDSLKSKGINIYKESLVDKLHKLSKLQCHKEFKEEQELDTYSI